MLLYITVEGCKFYCLQAFETNGPFCSKGIGVSSVRETVFGAARPCPAPSFPSRVSARPPPGPQPPLTPTVVSVAVLGVWQVGFVGIGHNILAPVDGIYVHITVNGAATWAIELDANLFGGTVEIAGYCIGQVDPGARGESRHRGRVPLVVAIGDKYFGGYAY
jgi:hypothetical protein